MTLTYIGHACFLVTADNGLRILVDPFQPWAFGGRIGITPFEEEVDVVASTHAHADHFHLDTSFGSPEVIRGTGNACGIEFLGLELPHGAEPGHDEGTVTGLRFEVDGVSIFHPGDIGRPPTQPEAEWIMPLDVLLLPVGGTFTIGPHDAMRTISALRPAVAVPMHYRTERVDLRIAPLDDFLTLAPDYVRAVRQPVRLVKHKLPQPTRVLVMDPTH
ncbi:MAG: MBL fold metallo-hydrolase [Deltaproteobacteria bacterium]|nr:MBL fold metallo-hydrolase [Deltaproteobacteria bacterium]